MTIVSKDAPEFWDNWVMLIILYFCNTCVKILRSDPLTKLDSCLDGHPVEEVGFVRIPEAML